MKDSAILAIAKDAAYYEETNPCSEMDLFDLQTAEKNLKEVLRFVRMARVSRQMEIRGENHLSY